MKRTLLLICLALSTMAVHPAQEQKKENTTAMTNFWSRVAVTEQEEAAAVSKQKKEAAQKGIKKPATRRTRI